jgi:murein DD-endopeptidase MepM/ murein hydrolase activator NlpD
MIASLLVFLVFGAVRLADHESLNLKYSATKSENEKLRKDNDVYSSSYEKLKGQVAYLKDVSNELARQAKMEPGSEIDENIGVGGPETVSALDKAADELERRLRTIGDRLRADQLRMASIPSGLPVEGYFSDGFGIRRNPFGEASREFHEGMDIAVEFGTPVSTTADGMVVWAEPHAGYGNLVAIYHSNGITTRYGHLSKITVERGQRVRRGDQIGHAGSTGRSTGPHVHYEIRENDQPVDPSKYIGAARP